MEKDNTLKPEFGCLGITDECMLRCKMCYKWKEDIFIDKGDLYCYPTVAQYRKFLGELHELVDDNFTLNFGGGEALLWENLFEVIRIAADYGFRTNLNSNGFLISEDYARRLGQSGLYSIKLSLDSMKREVHDYLRGVNGVYDRVMRAIDLLHIYAPQVKIAIVSVIYEQNYRDFIPLIEWINNNEKIEDVQIMAAMQPNNTAYEEQWWRGKYGFLWPKDRDAVCVLMDELIDIKDRGYKLNNSSPQLKAFKKYFAHPDEFVKKTVCNMYKAVHVSSIGQIFLCFEYGILGEVRKGHDVREIWHSAEADEVRESVKRCKKNCHFLINCFYEEDDDGRN